MARSCIFILLLFAFVVSCDYLPRGRFGDIDRVEVNDTIRIVEYVSETVYDTVYVKIPAPQNQPKHSIFIDTLLHYVGTREATGNNDGDIVEKFLNETCGFKNAPYCGAFLSYGLKVNGHPIPELPCWSPSFFPQERTVWNRGDKNKLKKGEIFGLYFRSKGRIAHVGAVVEHYNDDWIMCVEANTNEAGSRDGDGVYRKLRHKSQIHIASDWIE